MKPDRVNDIEISISNEKTEASMHIHVSDNYNYFKIKGESEYVAILKDNFKRFIKNRKRRFFTTIKFAIALSAFLTFIAGLDNLSGLTSLIFKLQLQHVILLIVGLTLAITYLQMHPFEIKLSENERNSTSRTVMLSIVAGLIVEGIILVVTYFL